MNVASLELCKELYDLSGWDDAPLSWRDYDEFDDDINGRGNYTEPRVYPEWVPVELPYYHYEVLAPAYDLGYLLRKLPQSLQLRHIVPDSSKDYWSAEHVPDRWYGEAADTPEDAAATLAIELFKLGILTK